MSELNILYEQSVEQFIQKMIDLIKNTPDDDDDDGDWLFSQRLEGFKFENFEIKNVQNQGGGEGEGEVVCWVVQLYKDDEPTNLFIQFTGFYSSEQGVTWDDDFTIVKPVQVLVTKYIQK